MVRGYQVFAIEDNTILGVVTTQSPLKNRLVRAMAAGTITFIFSGSNLTIPVTGGEDYICSEECTGVTSTANVLMS